MCLEKSALKAHCWYLPRFIYSVWSRKEGGSYFKSKYRTQYFIYSEGGTLVLLIADVFRFAIIWNSYIHTYILLGNDRNIPSQGFLKNIYVYTHTPISYFMKYICVYTHTHQFHTLIILIYEEWQNSTCRFLLGERPFFKSESC